MYLHFGPSGQFLPELWFLLILFQWFCFQSYYFLQDTPSIQTDNFSFKIKIKFGNKSTLWQPIKRLT